MKKQDSNAAGRQRRADRFFDPMQGEPSMSAPSPMPGKTAASFPKPPVSERPFQANWDAQKANWQSSQGQQTPSGGSGWSTQQAAQSYTGYPVQQGYQPPPSQGIPGGQLPPQQYGTWQQGYTPSPQQGRSQSYQQPSGRGWTQPYPVQQPYQQSQGNWQGGYTVNQWSGNGYSPDQGNHVIPGAPQGQENGNRPPHNRSAMIKLISVAVVLVAAVAIVIGVIGKQNEPSAIQAAVSAYNDRYCEGVYVDGIHLGGMTREEARAAVQKSAQLKCDEWNVSLVTTSGEYVGEINSYHLGMTVHVDDALDAAWTQGHTGATVNDRKAAMDALLQTPFHTATALPSGDTANIDRILYEIADRVYIPATDASAVFDPQLTNPFTITPETVGRYLDIQSIKEQVYQMVSRMESGVITIEPTPLYPAVTAADIKQQTTLIGTHYTEISSTSTPERNTNVIRACELINGTVIGPGKTFSFNSVVGARTKNNGFKIATVYSYGKEEAGYGGGVCQVSSTMYVAAIRANMEITKRTQHGLVVGYTKLGLDATVNYDGRKIDFAFRNNTDSNIYIITKVKRVPKINKNHDLVICEIYGPALEPGVTYDLIATEVQIPIPAATTVPDKKAEHVVYTDETYTEPGRIGYEVDSYRVKYVNGEKVEELHMYHDTYPAVQPVHYVGVSERPLPTADPW